MIKRLFLSVLMLGAPVAVCVLFDVPLKTLSVALQGMLGGFMWSPPYD